LVAPILKTARLDLVAFETRHLTKAYVSWLNDADNVRYSEQRHRSHTLASCQEFIARVAAEPNYLWAIERRSDQLHIGNLTAYVDVNNRIAELSILLGSRGCQGRGYGREAWQAGMHYLLESGLRRVEAGTMAENVPMLKVMERTGMLIEGTRRGHFLLDEKPVDLILTAFEAKRTR
jgi:RimJ/RimL family protein N-acetyltransferase